MKEPWVDIATLGLAMVGGGFGLFQYWRGQAWKQLEFVAQQVRLFESDPQCVNAMLILDWKQREIELYPKEPTPKDRYAVVNDGISFRALATRQTETKEAFDGDEPEIRACFDAFFGYLQKFDQFIKAGLVKKKQFQPFLSYWLNLIGNRDDWNKEDGKGTTYMRQLLDFIAYYGYSDVIRLFRRYGKDISLAASDVEKLRKVTKL